MEKGSRKKLEQLFKWEVNYSKFEKGESTKSILREFSESDADFTTALELIEKQGLSVLDIGCGYGDLSAQIATLGYHVLGIDFSQLAIKRAIEKQHTAQISCHFQVMDFFANDLKDRFEIITDRGFLAVLEANKHASYFEKTTQLMKPKGHYLLKIDEKRITKFPVLLELFNHHFSLVKTWPSTYVRSDGKVVHTNFYIGIKK